MDDDVRTHLRERGCPDEVVEAGIAGLVEDWERVVEEVVRGYPLGLDDYLNDIDTRQLIEETLPLVPADDRPGPMTRVLLADERIRPALDPVEECLWGQEVADAEGWTPESEWWYYHLPRAAGPLLREDLQGL